MNLPSAFIAAVLGFTLTLNASAQQRTETQPAPGQTSPAQPKPTADELEAKFKALLTNATLTGRWSSVNGGVLGAEREDKYSIVGATKLEGESWVVSARLEYRGRAFVLPIPVQVKWAGDTAVLVVDNMGMPGGATTYSARVLFHDQSYVGTWSGGEHGGLLYGLITHAAAPAPAGPHARPPAGSN